MEDNLTVKKLKERFPQAPLEVNYFQDQTMITVPKEKLVEIGRFLRDDPQLVYNLLADIVGVDWLDRPQRHQLVYNLYSIPKNQRVFLIVWAQEGETVDTVTGIWGAADFHEREVYDFFGVTFKGHPNLTRILMPDDWQGHPLRKDFPVEDMPRWWEVGRP